MDFFSPLHFNRSLAARGKMEGRNEEERDFPLRFKIFQSKMKKEETSAQGFEFVIHKDAAMVSQTIRSVHHPGLSLIINLFSSL